MDNIERTGRTHDATAHPSWAPGESARGVIEKLHFESEQRVRVPKSGAPRDAEVVSDGATIRAQETSPIANESYEAFVMYVNPYIGNGVPLNPLIYDPARQRALLMNPASNSVPIMVGKLPQVQVGLGFQLAPGQQIEIKTRQAVYAAAASGGTSIPLSVWVERGPGERLL